MKRIGGLYDSISTRGNVATAAWRAAMGKRHRLEVVAFFADYPAEMDSICRSLQKGSYTFSAYRSFMVRDTKSRLIQAPAFRDRVVHHAMVAQLGPIFEQGAIDYSYACRKGKGQHQCLQHARELTRRSRWYGKMDIKKFYDSVDHSILRRLLHRRFRESRVLQLFDALLASYQTEPGKGLPIGALTSQYLGNFYLDEWDRKLQQWVKGSHYARYMDDTVVWGSEPQIAEVGSAAKSIAAELGLTIKNGGEWNRCQQGLPFLGFVIYPDRMRLNHQAKKRFRRKYRQLLQQDYSELESQARCTSLFAHSQQAEDVHWRNQMIEFYQDKFGGRLEQQPCDTGRVLEQQGGELPLCLPQQEPSRQPQQEPGVPGGLFPRNGGIERGLSEVPPDDTCSRAAITEVAKATGKTPADADIYPVQGHSGEEGVRRSTNLSKGDF